MMRDHSWKDDRLAGRSAINRFAQQIESYLFDLGNQSERKKDVVLQHARYDDGQIHHDLLLL